MQASSAVDMSGPLLVLAFIGFLVSFVNAWRRYGASCPEGRVFMVWSMAGAWGWALLYARYSTAGGLLGHPVGLSGFVVVIGWGTILTWRWRRSRRRPEPLDETPRVGTAPHRWRRVAGPTRGGEATAVTFAPVQAPFTAPSGSTPGVP